MNQQDLIINKIPVILNSFEDWQDDNIYILKPDASKNEVLDIINYLYNEGFILDRRIDYKIV